MRAYVAKRLLIAGVTLLGMSVLIFVLMRLTPGNITDIIFESAGYVDQEDKKRLERELGIDRPVTVQYARWMADLARGELGKSYRYELPAWDIIRPRLPVTLELAVLALVVSVLLGVPTGVISAIRQDRPLDYALRVLSLAGLSMPSFWLGMVVILLLVRSLGWIPSVLYVSPFEDLRANVLQFLFPALAVGYRSSALIMRITRSAMLEVLREDYIRTAWAKGQREALVVWRHALKNASLPVVTLIGIEFAFLIGGLIVTETVFNLPGVARYLVDAIQWRDYPIVQNLTMLIACVVVLVNLTVDLLYAWLDPRIKYGRA
jgi:peptide/nickel transport system permease protein